MNYEQFLASKRINDAPTGLVELPELSGKLFDYQRAIVGWALRRGRACIWADCGLGKTPMQLEWARHVPGRVLVFAPLAVSQQTIREGEKFGIFAEYARSQKQADAATAKVIVTNYEMMEHFDASKWGGIVLDESSIIKSQDGATRDLVLSKFDNVPFRLACTATPAPNDYMELGNHAEFVGAMTREEMLAMFFVHDGGETQKWRLKGHARKEFWKWVCQWAVMIRKPSDIGFNDDGFTLPALDCHEHIIHADIASYGELIPMPAATLQERIGARRATVDLRVNKCAALVNAESDGQWLVWCNLNSESEALARAIPGAVEVSGSDSMEHKEASLMGFASGAIRVLISKPKIAGWGMNFQSCHNMAFVGLSDSWESYYQAVRRCWRFGQKNAVNVHVITADTEGAVVANIKRKEKDAEAMAKEMVGYMHDLNTADLHGATKRDVADYKTETQRGESWEMRLGDCVDVARSMPDESIDYSVFSPPFASLFTFSNSDRDMSNASDDQFMKHFAFLVRELFRVTKSGRLVSFHCMNLPTSKQHHGQIGIRDFRGELVRLFQSHGFIFHSEVCIWKDPVIAMQRTKAIGLLWRQVKKDSALSRQAIADYLVTMRKPGDNVNPITKTAENFPCDVWENYASPVWMDIVPGDTLQRESARENNDERHISPTQLEVARRAIRLWSNPQDIVFSPFAGIGSEGHVAIQEGRRFIGAELKESYYNQAVLNLKAAEAEALSGDLFDANAAP